MVVTVLGFVVSLGAIVVGLLVLTDGGRTEAGPRRWVYWPGPPRYGRRAFVPGAAMVAVGAIAFVIHLVATLR